MISNNGRNHPMFPQVTRSRSPLIIKNSINTYQIFPRDTKRYQRNGYMARKAGNEGRSTMASPVINSLSIILHYLM